MRKAQLRGYWLCLLAGVFAQTIASEAPAQSYPSKPIRIVVGFSPGGGTDVTARLVAQKLSAELGQSVVVENRTGAAGIIAGDYVARQPADGYTLLMVASTTLINAVLRGKSLEPDFAPVTLVTTAPLVLVVHPSVPARNVKQLIALARSRPGALVFGSDGVGGTTHLAFEQFSEMAKVKLVHVPYKGAGDSVVAVVSGQVDMNMASAPATLPLLRAGKYRALAVSSEKRYSLLPSIPSISEAALPGFNLISFFGLLAPKAMPKDIVARVNAAVSKVVNTPELIEAINKQGMEAQTNSPEQFTEFMRTMSAQIARLGKSSGIELK